MKTAELSQTNSTEKSSPQMEETLEPRVKMTANFSLRPSKSFVKVKSVKPFTKWGMRSRRPLKRDDT